MPLSNASSVTTYGIVAITLVVAAMIMIGARSKGVAFAIPVIMAAQLYLASSGILRQWERRPPPLMTMLAAGFVMTALLAFRASVGKQMALTLSFAALIGAQAFRLPLELVMHHAASDGVMPVQMSYSGSNFDVITGVTAILVAFLAANGSAPRWLLIAWNALGSLLLLNVIVIAVISTPGIAAFGSDHLNTWVAYAPFVWLPGILVPGALLGHLVVWRKLWTTSR